MTKLSEPQFKLLCAVALKPHYVAEYYPPAKSLLKHGLIKRNLGGMASVTEKGMQLLTAIGKLSRPPKGKEA